MMISGYGVSGGWGGIGPKRRKKRLRKSRNVQNSLKFECILIAIALTRKQKKNCMKMNDD